MELPNAGGGDMGGGGTWNGLPGSVPCLCPYILELLVGVELGVELAVRAFARGGEMGVGLAVRDFGGGGGRAGPGLEVGIGGSGFTGGRPWERSPKPRPDDFGSVGEKLGETGDSDPLAVFALRLEPPDEGAESRFGFLGDPEGDQGTAWRAKGRNVVQDEAGELIKVVGASPAVVL
ncbi:hypothetical protein N0V93_008481 [Gnomoniopsis smithogilvyi]|uniref:Uncharacterized protein n=1 Tax=Gnomoniopsis smithogilvyi TaxID=1191159 RepID=A0A9W8YP84_9PEZI|nr:hypothetical protein N0V93_008481 [Gnomoniopsis smithogilvyi]